MSSRTFIDAAVAASGSTFYVLGATSTGLVLGYGPKDSLVESSFPFSDGAASWTANRVGIYADSDRVILAAARSDGIDASGAPDVDDQVGWVFLAR
jgi:hypothetical protein